MVRILKSELSTAPRIDAISPSAALPGGDVEEWRRPVAMLRDLAAPVLLSRNARLTLRVPDEAESGRLRILQNGAQSNAVEVRVGSLIATGVHAVANPVMDHSGNIFVTFSGRCFALSATVRCGPLCAAL